MTPTPSPGPELAQAAAASDPTLLALFSILGVGLTIIAGFVGAWIQGRREHNRWLREQRYEAFANMLALTGKIAKMWADVDVLEERAAAANAAGEPTDKLLQSLVQLRERAEKAYATFDDAAAPLLILGPTSVITTLNSEVGNLIDKDRSKASDAEDKIATAMRKALGVKD